MSPAPFRQSSRAIAALAAAMLVVAAAVAVFVGTRGGSAGRDASSAQTTFTASPSPSLPEASTSRDQTVTPKTSVSPSPTPSPSKKIKEPDAPSPAVQTPSVVRPLPAKSFDQQAQFGNGVTARILQSKVVTGKGRGPGEISGPAVRLGLLVVNGSSKAIDLDGSTVNAYYSADRTPAPQLTGDPSSKPFSGSVTKGERAKGIYVFQVPREGSKALRVELSYGPTSAIVTFAGAAHS